MTTGSFGIDAATGQFTVTYGTRTVQTTGGTLVCLVPALQQFNGLTVTYPDPPNKDWIYAWRGKNDYQFDPSSAPDHYGQNNIGQTVFTRPPQEYETAQNLMAAPAGADFFVGWLRLSRSSAPSHVWNQRILTPMVKEGAWIPWMGSGLIEAALGISRALHLVIEGGFLKLIAEQSVGPPCGGASRTWGDYPNIFVYSSDREGGSFQYNVAPGVVVWTSTDSPYRKSSSRQVDTDSPAGPGSFTTHLITGSDPASTTDPTNYQSVYTVDVKGRFGRRS